MVFTVFVFLAVFSVLVFVHEFGHFIAAKKVGVRVEEFGFGLPPRLYGRKIGETTYSLNLLPIGGFLRLAGEEATEYASLGDPGSFAVKPPFKRAIILLAGVAGNFLLGWLTFVLLFWVGLPLFSEQVIITKLEPGSPAQQAGLLEEDTIQALDETKISYSWEVSDYVEVHQEPIQVSVKRGQESLTFLVAPKPYLGVYVSNFVWRTSTPWYWAPVDAFKESLSVLGAVFGGVGHLLGSLLTKREVPGEIAGPVGMAQIISVYAELGWRYLLQVLASISLNLALINALPFPALDGGRLVFVVWEAVTHRRVSPKWEGRFHQAGMALLLLLILLITFQDIKRFL